ncbi:hypothetical protein [Streptomyces sp. NBC_01803]|uniref:hypothetical protein n=1 Tax=Streptomyces sp. NBC_01803 TaxID=2975946 RepID=UPI002DD8FF24|nr:hypothetical protein [Streptomyces sp. NBC_01803]WSA42892.1 hypothetical protein OIE51_00930 [Streptomyces sp. NBC_01803]
MAPFSPLVPVFGMSSAAVLLGEGISAARWLAAVPLVGGVALTSFGRARTGGGSAVRAAGRGRPRPGDPAAAVSPTRLPT